MPLENIVYENDFVLDVVVTNSGNLNSVTFPDQDGYLMDIDQVHTGSASYILYDRELLEIQVLQGGEISYIF